MFDFIKRENIIFEVLDEFMEKKYDVDVESIKKLSKLL